jgi:hypothetical protein
MALAQSQERERERAHLAETDRHIVAHRMPRKDWLAYCASARAAAWKYNHTRGTQSCTLIRGGLQSGARLFPGAAVSIALVENGMVKAAAVAERDPLRAELWRQRFPFPLTREYMHSVAILDRKMGDIPNGENAPAEMEVGRKNFLVSSPSSKPSKPLATGPAKDIELQQSLAHNYGASRAGLRTGLGPGCRRTRGSASRFVERT